MSRLSRWAVALGMACGLSTAVAAQQVMRIVAVYNGESISLRADSSGRLRVVNEGGIAGTCPGAADTEVLFNNAGTCDGDAGLTYEAASDTLTVVGLLEGGTLDVSGAGAVGGALTAQTYQQTYDTAGVTDTRAFFNEWYVEIDDTATLANLTAGFRLEWVINSGTTLAQNYFRGFDVAVTAANTVNGETIRAMGFSAKTLGDNIENVEALVGAALVESGGTAEFGYGISASAEITDATVTDTAYGVNGFVTIQGTSDVHKAVAGYFSLYLNGNVAVLDEAYLNYAKLDLGGSAKPDVAYGYWVDELAGKATTAAYPFWYHGNGGDCAGSAVTRINELGIFAYYNPCFTAYTPAAANFERIRARWGDTGVEGTDNRALMGTEAGGTGTVRPLDLSAANLSVTSTLTPAVTDTSANSCGTGTQTIAGNDNAGKVTVIGSAGTSCTVTFATAFVNAPSCTVTNETTANLSRATSTTTTVILAGVFAQNDVIAYLCLGR